MLLAEYFFSILWMREGKIQDFFFPSNFQHVHVLLQQLVRWKVENLSSGCTACFCRSTHKGQNRVHSQGAGVQISKTKSLKQIAHDKTYIKPVGQIAAP